MSVLISELTEAAEGAVPAPERTESETLLPIVRSACMACDGDEFGVAELNTERSACIACDGDMLGAGVVPAPERTGSAVLLPEVRPACMART